jgi:peptide chain release factor 2/peptide chain release factor
MSSPGAKVVSRYCVQVTAGRGPAPARQFVALLAERLLAIVEAGGLLVVDVTIHGDEAEPGSVEILVIGDAPRALAEECGTHALVAPHASRGKAARKRWFAAVALLVAAEEPDREGAHFAAHDLEITAMRASGPGGQNVNKTSTAVRVRHRPSGITVRMADERSQQQNLRRALQRIAAKLAEAAEQARAEGGSRRRDAHDRVERGAPVRTYRLGRRGELALSISPCRAPTP